MARHSLTSDDIFLFTLATEAIDEDLDGGKSIKNTYKFGLVKVDNIHESRCGHITLIANIDEEYDEIEVYNVIISGDQLKDLLRLLANNSWSINRQGYIYLQAPYYAKHGLRHPGERYRLNDLFCWTKYEVFPERQTIWNRLEIETDKVVIDNMQKDKFVEEYKKMDKLLEEYKETLEEAEKKLNNTEKDLKEEEEKKSLLEEKVNELSPYKELCNKKEKELADLNIRFVEKEEKFTLLEKQFFETEKTLEKVEKELADLKTSCGGAYEPEISVTIVQVVEE